MSELVSFLEKREYSFLERLPSHQRMTARDNAGRKNEKKTGKTKKHYEEHYRKDWDKDLWD